MHSTLPTEALTVSRIPSAEADDIAFIRFAQTLNGYTEVGGEASALGAYLKELGLLKTVAAERMAELSLRDLRILLFARQRAHYHSGGGWPDGDPIMDEMRALTAVIRERVAARGQGVAVWRGDITQLDVDAIVNAANRTLAGGGGVDGAIHRAAGPELLEACLALPEMSSGVRCLVGEARITEGYKLAAKHVIHTVGPVWHGGEQNEAALLASAYRSALWVATTHELDTIAFASISTGAYGYPIYDAAQLAVDTVRAFLDAYEKPVRVLLVAFDARNEEALRRALGEPAES